MPDLTSAIKPGLIMADKHSLTHQTSVIKHNLTSPGISHQTQPIQLSLNLVICPGLTPTINPSLTSAIKHSLMLVNKQSLTSLIISYQTQTTKPSLTLGLV